jgi:hypothetical protein
MEDYLNFFENGRQPKTESKQTVIKRKHSGCGTAPGNLVFLFVSLISSMFKTRY